MYKFLNTSQDIAWEDSGSIDQSTEDECIVSYISVFQMFGSSWADTSLLTTIWKPKTCTLWSLNQGWHMMEVCGPPLLSVNMRSIMDGLESSLYLVASFTCCSMTREFSENLILRFFRCTVDALKSPKFNIDHWKIKCWNHLARTHSPHSLGLGEPNQLAAFIFCISSGK